MAGPSDKGGGWSSDGGLPDDLPDLPEEWGVIVIPDDLSELDDEVAAVRAELRLAEKPTRWRRFVSRPGVRRARRLAFATLRAPVLIISMAVLVTVASLFASAWPGPPRQPATQRTASTTDDHTSLLPVLNLSDASGQNVQLFGQLPAVILLIEDCECAELVSKTIAEVKPRIAVITVAASTTATPAGSTPPTGATPQAQGKTVRVLNDPAGTVRKALNLGKPYGTAAVLLVNGNHQIIRTVESTLSFDDIGPDLARL